MRYFIFVYTKIIGFGIFTEIISWDRRRRNPAAVVTPAISKIARKHWFLKQSGYISGHCGGKTKTRSAAVLAGPDRSRRDPENEQNIKKTLGFKAIRLHFGVPFDLDKH